MNKSLINHHIHTTGSDGAASPEEMIKKSIESGLKFICFTDHYPYPPWVKDNVGRNFHSDKYYYEVKKAIEKYKDKIEISLGAEIEFFPENAEWIKSEIKRRNWDFVLGALHQEANKLFYNKENLPQEEAKILIKEYYPKLREMIKSRLFDCVAHLDLIKLVHKRYPFLLEESEEYRQEILKTLNEIQNAKICVEVNTSSLRKGFNEQHPSTWILKEIKKRGIPVTLGSDAHNSEEHLILGLKDALNLLRKLGFDSIIKFKKRKMIEVPL